MEAGQCSQREHRYGQGAEEGGGGVGEEELEGLDVARRGGHHVSRPAVLQATRRGPLQCGVEPLAEVGQESVGDVVLDPHLDVPAGRADRDGAGRPAEHDRPGRGVADDGSGGPPGHERGGGDQATRVRDPRDDRHHDAGAVGPQQAGELEEPGG